MNISLSARSQEIVKKLLERGYPNPDEVIEQALQQLDEAENLEQLRVELIKSEQSGESVPFDLVKIKTRVSENIKNGVKVKQSAALPQTDNSAQA